LDGDEPELAIHEDLPTQEDMAKLILQRKKELLMQQYASSALQAETESAKSMAGAQ
jgi:6-pyruvoyl-tetrahydropterin synthase